MCCGSGVSCDRTPGRKMCICRKSCRTWTESCGTRSNCGWPTCGNMCSCCGLEAVRGQVRKLLFKMNRRVPNGRESTARLDNESCVCGVAVIEHFVFSCAAADSIIIRRCRFRVGSLRFVLTVVMMLFGHHRRHKVGMWCMFIFQCCCFSFILLQ